MRAPADHMGHLPSIYRLPGPGVVQIAAGSAHAPVAVEGHQPTARLSIIKHKKRPDDAFDDIERRRFRRVPGLTSSDLARIPPACATSLTATLRAAARARGCVPVSESVGQSG